MSRRRRPNGVRRVNGREVVFLGPDQPYDPSNFGVSRPVDGEDTRGDAAYFRLVQAAIEGAKLDIHHQCDHASCGIPRKARGKIDCSVRESAERFLRDMRAGRHWLSSWLTLAALRSGLDTLHEPGDPKSEPVPTLFTRSAAPEAEPVEPARRRDRSGVRRGDDHPKRLDVERVHALGLLTIDEAADRLGVNRKTVMAFADDGDLEPTTSIGESRAFDPAAIDAFMLTARYRVALVYRKAALGPDDEQPDDADVPDYDPAEWEQPVDHLTDDDAVLA